jgi:hypothetical protein
LASAFASWKRVRRKRVFCKLWAQDQDDFDWFLYMGDEEFLETTNINLYLSVMDHTQEAFVVGSLLDHWNLVHWGGVLIPVRNVNTAA